MEANAKIALWEGKLSVQVSDDIYETVGRKVRVELEVVNGVLIVGLTPDPDGMTLVPASSGEVTAPWRVCPRVSRFKGEEALLDGLKRSGSMRILLEGTRLGVSGEIDLVPHRRPWPKLRPCKAYDVATRSVEVYKERILSCATTGDVWTVPPKDFMQKCPKSFMTIWGEMPAGLSLRMDDGHVHRR